MLDASDTRLQAPAQANGAYTDGPRRVPRVTWAIVGAAVLLALILRIYWLTRPGMLLGAPEYDDGEYLGSAIRLAGGALPYRDFAFVQPPGITLLMFPLGVLAKATTTGTAMAAARILTACAGGVTVLLAGLLVRHRGVLATALVCGLLAVHPDAVAASTTLFLETWLVLMCLIGALLALDRDHVTVRPRRQLWAGVAFGFATAIKVWAVFPAFVLLVLVMASRGRKATTRYLLGGVLGFGIPVIPFAALAPRRFYDGVIGAQLHQTDVSRVRFSIRLWHLLGLKDLTLSTRGIVAISALVIGGVAVCWLAAWLLRRAIPTALEWFAMGSALVVGLSFFVPMEFFPHYAAFFAPFLALAVGLAVAGLFDALRIRGRAAPVLTSRRLAAGLVGLAAVAFVWMAVTGLHRESSLHALTPAASLERAIPAGACVITDNSAFTIVSDRFLAKRPGCTTMVDATGTDMTLGRGRNALTGAGRYPAVAALWSGAFAHAQYVFLSCGPARAARCHAFTNRRIPWTSAIWAYFTHHFRRVGHGPYYVYARTGG